MKHDSIYLFLLLRHKVIWKNTVFGGGKKKFSWKNLLLRSTTLDIYGIPKCALIETELNWVKHKKVAKRIKMYIKYFSGLPRIY